LIFDKEFGFLYRGRMESTWRKERTWKQGDINIKKSIRVHLEEYLFGNPEKKIEAAIPIASVLEFVMKLAAKIAQKKDI